MAGPANLPSARPTRLKGHEEVTQRMPKSIVRDEVRELMGQGAQVLEVLPPEEYEAAAFVASDRAAATTGTVVNLTAGSIVN